MVQWIPRKIFICISHQIYINFMYTLFELEQKFWMGFEIYSNEIGCNLFVFRGSY